MDGRFEVLAEVGSGGMGTVHRAIDLSTGEYVALKLARSKADPERFQSEALALAAVSHPRIVRYISHGIQASGEQYLAMEWLDGVDLAARITKGPLSIEETLVVGRGAAEALDALHARGTVHRDVKPGNLFLVESDLGRVKLLDFGIVRAAADQVRLTATGQALGTPAYMAPEQARGGEQLSPAADVFALGCVLFECLTGRPPFVGDHPIAVLAKLLIQEAPKVTELRPDVPAWLSTLIARMLSKERAERPRDAAAVLVELHRPRDRPSQSGGTERVRTALTADEQRMLCVVLSRSAGETDATMLPSQRTLAEDRLRAMVTSRGGRIEMLANGSMLAAVSGGESPDDVAARAARCALAMASVVTTPVVLATGRGVVAGRLPAGAVVDQAVALLSAEVTRQGVVRIDESTAGLLASRFEVRAEGPAFYLLGEREPDAERKLLGRSMPCVGRERETATLTALIRESFSEPIARAVLVVAPAGGGKTRLVQEALRDLPSCFPEGSPDRPKVLVLRARGDVATFGSPFSLTANLLQRAAGIVHGERPDLRHQKLRARIGLHVPAAQLVSTAEVLGDMAGAPSQRPLENSALLIARSDPIAMGDAIRMAWEDWLSAESGAGPVVIVIEDLHWGDAPSLGLLDAALRRLADRPFIVLATARPEVKTAFPDLWVNRGVQEIRLGPLTPRASEKLVREALGPALDDDTVTFLARRAEGHPFFLEELIRAISEGRGRDSLPDNVLGMLEGRLDALDPELRRVLRAASVLGSTFWRGAVATLMGGMSPVVGRLLDDLTSKEIIVRSRLSRVTNEVEYSFQHALVRDAAYAMLTDDDRRLGHLLAGAWLASVGETDPVVLAEHFRLGADNENALKWQERAACAALESNDLKVALARAERALALDPDESTRARIELIIADASFHQGELASACAAAESAALYLPKGTAPWYQAIATLVRAAGQLGENDRVMLWVGHALQTNALDDEATGSQIICLCRGASQLLWAQRGAEAEGVIARVAVLSKSTKQLPKMAVAAEHRVLAERAFLLDGRLDVMAREYGAACEALDAVGAFRETCLLRAMWGAALGMLGDVSAAEKAVFRAIAEAERIGSSYLVSFGYAELPLAYLGARRYEDARASCVRALAGLAESPRLSCGIHIALAIVAIAENDLALADDEVRAALAIRVAPAMRGLVYALRAKTSLCRGKLEEALADAREGVRLAQAGAVIEMFSGTVELVLAQVLAADGQHEAAREALREAVRRVRALADPISDANVRGRFLAQSHPNSEIFALAHEWQLPFD